MFRTCSEMLNKKKKKRHNLEIAYLKVIAFLLFNGINLCHSSLNSDQKQPL